MIKFFDEVKILKTPRSKKVVIFQCDENFFNSYGFYNLVSCEKHNLNVHIHFINPSKLFLNKIKNLNLDIQLSYSQEFINTDINFYKLKSYYFCSRYYITNYLFEKELIEEAFITDADIIFNEQIEIPSNFKLGILYFPKHNNLWKQTGANFSYIHKNKKSFLETVIKIYEDKLITTKFENITDNMNKVEKANLYGLDQVCMSLALKENFIDNEFINLTIIDKFIGKSLDFKIWSLTGGGKSNSNLKFLLDRTLPDKYKHDKEIRRIV